jgi:hypothetical protein
VIDLKSTKPTKFDAPALHQAHDHDIEYRIDRSLGILGSQLGIVCRQLGNQFGLVMLGRMGRKCGATWASTFIVP